MIATGLSPRTELEIRVGEVTLEANEDRAANSLDMVERIETSVLTVINSPRER